MNSCFCSLSFLKETCLTQPLTPPDIVMSYLASFRRIILFGSLAASLSAQTPMVINFDDGSNPFSTGTVSTDYAVSGSSSLFLGSGQTATFTLPSAFQSENVEVTMQVLDLGRWVDRTVSGYPTNGYGPRWGVGIDFTGPKFVAGTIIEKTYYPSTSGYGVHRVTSGDAFNVNSWFSIAHYTGSSRLVLSDNGGSNPGTGWVPGSVADEPVWMTWTFTVMADGETTIQLNEMNKIIGDNLGGPATSIFLYGGNQNALVGLYIDDISIKIAPSGPPDLEAPSVPTGLVASNVTDTSVDLDWNASTDNVKVTGYRVYTDGENPVSLVETSATVVGLSPETDYTFTVSALDAAGNESAQSDGVGVTTDVSSTYRYGFPIVSEAFINTRSFLGWLYLSDAGWSYSYNLNCWVWVAESYSTDLTMTPDLWVFATGKPSDAASGSGLVFGYEVVDEHIHAEDFLGWLYIPMAPWSYAWSLDTWVWIDSDLETDLKSDPRSWLFVKNAEAGYPLEVLKDDPVAYWRFSETDGDVTVDEISGLEAVLVNEPDLGLLGQGSAIGFSAADAGYIEVPDDSVLDLTGSLSLEFWINPLYDVTLFTGLIGKGDDTYVIRRNGLGRGLRFEVRGGDGGNVTLNSSYQLPALEWTHVVAVYDAEAGQMRMYFNGQQDANVASRTGSLGTNNHGLQIGANFSGSDYRRFLTGVMDEVAIYDHALSSARIKAHYNSARVDPTGIPLDIAELSVLAYAGDAVSIEWSTGLLGSTARVHYGLSPEALSQTSSLIDSGHTSHKIDLADLEPESTYYYRVESTDARGRTVLSEVGSFETLALFELANAEATHLTHNGALIRWESNNPANAQVVYGLSPEALSENSHLVNEGDLLHRINLTHLEPETTYYYQVTSTDKFGDTKSGDILSFVTPTTGAVLSVSEITQHGITWTFDKQHQAGRFANGDWWVVGPVNVVSVDPAPSVAPPDEFNDFGPNQFGDFGLRNNDDKRNGSMVVMSPTNRTGFDSRGLNYRAENTLSFPYELASNRSLLSSRSYKSMPNTRMFSALMWASERNGNNPIRTVAVLTSLPEAPPADAFRPSYVGSEKKLYRVSDLRWDRLHNLSIPASSMPSWTQWERYFQRVWVDHMNGSWNGQHLLPNENQASYGREIARIVGQASLMLHLDVPQEQKRKLLIGLVQNGIDLRAMVDLGANYNEGGGHTSGRKWPVLFAGLMLDDESFFEMPATAVFHEDTQTYYGEGWAGQTALWQMVIHHGVRLTYMHLHPDNWATYDGGWARTSESYRVNTTIRAWTGQTLAALLMGAKPLWNHNAYFDNVEDWMRQEDIYAANRGGVSRPGSEGTAFDAFVTNMWTLYRDQVPDQADGDLERMWIPTGGGLSGSWAPNPKPDN